MRVRQLGTIGIAAMVVLVGVAALGAASPADATSRNATDAHDDRPDAASEVDGPPADPTNASADGVGDGVGPSGGLPGQVPDHVSTIHETIDSFAVGELDELGESLRNVLSGGEAAADSSDPAGESAGDAADHGEIEVE